MKPTDSLASPCRSTVCPPGSLNLRGLAALCVGAILTSAAVPTVYAAVTFDNGHSSGTQSRTANDLRQRLYENFKLTTSSAITEIHWQQHDDSRVAYAGTRISIYEGLPEVSALLYSADVRATRTPNATGTIFGTFEGYDYSVKGLTICLPAGTYWLGLNSLANGSGWDDTTGGSDNLRGARVINSIQPAPGGNKSELAFQLVSEPVAFDNGSSSGSQPRTANDLTQRLYDNFRLDHDTTVIAFCWQQHDWTNRTDFRTQISIYQGLPEASTLLFTTNVIPARATNDTGRIFNIFDGFTYSVGGLAIPLRAGTYWVGFNSIVGSQSGWDNTTGGPDTLPGARLINDGFAAPGTTIQNLAFQVFTADPTLNIERAVIVSWPNFPPGYVLRSAALPTGPYTDYPGTIHLEGTEFKAAVPARSSQKYFKLVRP